MKKQAIRILSAVLLTATFLTGCGNRKEGTIHTPRKATVQKSNTNRSSIDKDSYLPDRGSSYSDPDVSESVDDVSTNAVAINGSAEPRDDSSDTGTISSEDADAYEQDEDTDTGSDADEDTHSGIVAADETPDEIAKKIIYRGSVDLNTKKFSKAKKELENAIEENDGFITQSSEDTDADDDYAVSYQPTSETGSRKKTRDVPTGRQWRAEIRIPAENFDKFMKSMDVDDAEITSKNTSSADLTKTYSDNEDRLDALKTEQSHLKKLLEKADKVSDMIQIEDRLAVVRSEIASVVNSNGDIDFDVKYTYVSIILKEVKTEKVKLETNYNSPAYWISDSWSTFGKVVIYLLPFALLITAVIFGVKKIKAVIRNRKDRRYDDSQDDEE